jgi:hypothetical protein
LIVISLSLTRYRLVEEPDRILVERILIHLHLIHPPQEFFALGAILQGGSGVNRGRRSGALRAGGGFGGCIWRGETLRNGGGFVALGGRDMIPRTGPDQQRPEEENGTRDSAASSEIFRSCHYTFLEFEDKYGSRKLKPIAISYIGHIVERFGDANRSHCVVRKGRKKFRGNFHSIIWRACCEVSNPSTPACDPRSRPPGLHEFGSFPS